MATCLRHNHQVQDGSLLVKVAVVLQDDDFLSTAGSDTGNRTRASASLRFMEHYLRGDGGRGDGGREDGARGEGGNRLTGLLLGQLDAFNRISTTFGHDASSAFCARYTTGLRDLLPEGTPVIRLSERRFAILLRLDSVSAVVDVAAGLADRSQPYMEHGDDRFIVDLTLGIAVYPTHADDAATLFRRAELALKEARDQELTFDMYQPESTQQHAALWKLESDLDSAVREGQLEVFYQPQLELGRPHVGGLEALVRWRRRSGQFVPPEEFIPIAERGGSIVPITWFVFDSVAAHAASWAALPKPLNVAVNLSPSVLGHRELDSRLDRLRRTLAGHGIGLSVEITEDSLVQNSEATPASLKRLRDAGIGLAIDDFGKGYSSLTYLKQIPATEIKIDRHFVSSIAKDDTDREIVRSVVDLAHALNMRVVAEGVDSSDNLEVVTRLGCEVAQGFFIARPMRADLVYDWINSHAVATRSLEAKTRAAAALRPDT